VYDLKEVQPILSKLSDTHIEEIKANALAKRLL